MCRYVDLDKLSNALCGLRDYQNGNVHFLNGIKTALEVADGMVEENLEEEKHGEWTGEAVQIDVISERCTNCGHRGMMAYFCGWCGARMDGGKE